MTKKKGFTLMELLVVIGIIALLAAIMMPALSGARESAKAAACLSNEKNVSTAIAVYSQDNRNYFPTCYDYINGASGGGGYNHWTAMINPMDYSTDANSISWGVYPKQSPAYVCPSHVPGGFAPTDHTTTRVPTDPASNGVMQLTQTAGIDDQQAARLSYVANEVLMPRKKYGSAMDANNVQGHKTNQLRFVNLDDVDHLNQTILFAEFTNYTAAIYGNSAGGSIAFKSHRPTNAIAVQGSYFDGEVYIPGTTPVARLTVAQAMADITETSTLTQATDTVTETLNHVTYVNPAAHSGFSNYAFGDGHAAKYTLAETMDSGNWMWGTKIYSCVDQPVLK